jgi:hypothetical protein
MAVTCITKIREQREALWQVLVLDKRKSYEKSWCRRLFRVPVPSDTEIRKSLERASLGRVYGTKSIVASVGAEAEEIALRLIRDTEHTHLIQVSAEDLQKIS